MGSTLTVPVGWAWFALIIVFLAGVGSKHLLDGLYWGYRSLRMPEPDVYEPVVREPVRDEPEPYEPEPVAPAADDELAELHTRQQWRYESAAERAARRPSEPPLEDAVMFDQTLTDLLQRSQMPALPSAPPTSFDPFPTGAYSIVDRDLDDLPATAVKPVVEGPVLPARQRFTGNKRKPSKRLAGVR